MRLYCPLIALLLIICSSLATAVTEADAGLIKRASLLDSITSFVGNAFGSGRSQESSGSASGAPAASSNAPGVSKDILDLYAA
ncbi:hypothetical protein GQ54DRAFT_220870 [Martensiomyces pterosporus]|nr:hypothetical protein GQ54DRAFT_220870 [Martensiomyces pterosporus]